MSISKRLEEKKNPKKNREQAPKVKITDGVILSQQELEFLIRMVGDSNFKGKDLMFIYELVKKLQDSYLSLADGSQ